MSSLVTAAFILAPLFLLTLAYTWAFHLHDRPVIVRRILLGLLACGTMTLVAGDAASGFHRAEGFHAGYWALGFLVVVLTYLVVFWRPRRHTPRACLRTAIDVVREDFRDPGPARSDTATRWLWVAGFLGLALLSYFALVVSARLNTNMTHGIQKYLDPMIEIVAGLSLTDFVTIHQCDNKFLFSPLTFLLVKATGPMDWLEHCHLRMLLIAVFAIVNLWMHRKRSTGLLLLSHLFLLLVLLEPAHDFNSSIALETLFALLFYLNLLMLLHVRFTGPFFLVLGLLLGTGFVTKELNIINLCLLAFVLATAGLTRRRFLELTSAALAGFAVPTFLFMWSFFHCGVSEGLYHIPFVWFRGAELARMTQANVTLMIDQGFEFSLIEMVVRRASFQTVGEVLFGAMSQFGLFTLVGVFPVAWMIGNLPRRQLRILGVFLLVSIPLYGVTHWKRGDSADPLYTMLPFGYIFAGPFLFRLGARFVAIIRHGQIPWARSWYIHVLVVVNLLFLGSNLSDAWQVVRDTRFIDKVTMEGISFTHAPTESERAIVETLRVQHIQGHFRNWFFLADCGATDMHKPLAILAPELTMNPLDIQYSLLQAILEGKDARVQNAFDMMIREIDYAQEDVETFLVVGCPWAGMPRQQTNADPDDNPWPLLDGCARILHASPDEDSLVLIEFRVESCRRYFRPELQRSRGVRQERPPAIPFLPTKKTLPKRIE